MDLSQLKETIVLLALVAIIGGTLAIGLDDFSNSLERTQLSVTDEVHTITPGTLVTLNNPQAVSVTVVENITESLATNEFALLNGGTDIARLNVTNTSKAATSYNVSYSYYRKDSDYNITMNGLTGVDNSTNYLDTTGTIAGVAILISLIVLAFGIMANRE